MGPNLPGDEIAKAARECGAKAVALSLVYPLFDSDLESELNLLHRKLRSNVRLIVGGRGVAKYATQLRDLGALIVRDLHDFPNELRRISA